MLQFPQPPDGHITYAVFTVASTRIPAGEVRIVETSPARDLALLDIPPDANSFYFCDAPPRDQAQDGDALRFENNLSPTIYIAREVISADEMRARLLASGTLKSLGSIPATRDQQGNLTPDVVRHAVWLSKSNSAPWHAVGRNGEFMPVRAGHNNTVIDENKNILMGPQDLAPRIAQNVPARAPRRTAPPPPDNRFKL